MFSYNLTHQVVVCHICHSCILPGPTSQERHLRAKPHRLLGNALKTTVQLLSSYNLRTIEELRAHKPQPEDKCEQIQQLTSYSGSRCLEPGCDYATRHPRKRREHCASAHKKRAIGHSEDNPLWEECMLQTYFTSPGRIDYFVVVVDNIIENNLITLGLATPLKEEEKDLFIKLEDDYQDVKSDIEKQATIVQDFGDSRSARVPWLERTGFPSHLVGLRDEEIKSSYQLPRETEGGEGAKEADADLVRIMRAAEGVLRDAYTLCSDTSPKRKMTQQRANILNEFYAGASGRSDGFRYYKNPSTLVKYFTTFKQLLVYFFRIVHNNDEDVDGHFTRADAEQRLPGQVICVTAKQEQAVQEIADALEAGEEDDDEAALKRAVRRLYLALICQTVGSVPFRSAVLSFCAMLSRKVRGEGRGLWDEPGNFNSHLSALTWTAQLIIFDYACFHEQEDEDRIPALLSTICKKFFQQLAETPFGHILQWRLYLFKVAKAAIAKHQARWSLDGQMVEYRGLELQMSHVSQLVVSEYQQAHALLYEELMFRAGDLVPMQSWRLKDDLDMEEFGGSWLAHLGNAEFVEAADRALLRRIRGSAELRAMFLASASDGAALSPKAMAIYEASAQEFLKRLLILVHIASGQPLREPELLSVTWRNTARQRHLFLWEKQVMVYTQYHKGQQQSGVYKDNIRFLPRAIGDLLLDYIAYVVPLRQTFLRQQAPKALVSAHLWARLDGSVWADGTLSACLRKACARARVPQLHTSNWRQMSAAICKEKFSGKEQASFDVEDGGSSGRAEDAEDELDLVAMAEQSNHTYRTFNQAYAGSSTLTTNALLHRNHRASETWRTFFRFDYVLQGKRPRGVSETLSLRMLDASKRGQVRRRGAYSGADLEAVACRLYNTPRMKLRVPGQRDGLLATMGPHPAEQVLLVMGTGSGKSLVFMVGASVADARTTILVLPMVALRGDMLDRCRRVGIQPLIWSIERRDSASLVIMSAEAVCTESFLEYAHLLVNRQQLDRIVIDECHLTITANDYRKCMSQVGWYVRQVKTQTVWLTATLPPTMQEDFIEHNKLVRPRIIRESTNRPNIKYMISRHTGATTLVEVAAELVQTYWPRKQIFNHARDKIIIYCQSRDDVSKLGEILGCPTYTSKSGTEEEKAEILSGWLSRPEQPVIVATSALGIGFDYPFVRWVVHVDAPQKMSDFSQESGRAGRDGSRASSIILLRSTWAARTSGSLSPDQEAMDVYLTQEHCSRGVLSQFLDTEADWRWCMQGEEACQVCGIGHGEARPPEVQYRLRKVEQKIKFTGPAEVLRQDQVRDEVLEGYERDLEVMSGSCLYCRAQGRKFDHGGSQCGRRFEWIKAKTEALEVRKKEGREWIERYLACWKCYQPQEICRVADPEHEESECRFPDMVMGLCYGVYKRAGGGRWLSKHFGVQFSTQMEYMVWLGSRGSLGGNDCIQANCVAAVALAEMGG